MSTISQYTVEIPGCPETGPWDEGHYREAEGYARQHGGRVIEWEYEFSDSSVVADFTEEGA